MIVMYINVFWHQWHVGLRVLGAFFLKFDFCKTDCPSLVIFFGLNCYNQQTFVFQLLGKQENMKCTCASISAPVNLRQSVSDVFRGRQVVSGNASRVWMSHIVYSNIFDKKYCFVLDTNLHKFCVYNAVRSASSCMITTK